jgi:hypothetical protein
VNPRLKPCRIPRQRCAVEAVLLNRGGNESCRLSDETPFRDLMNSDLIDMVESSFGSVWALELLLVLHRHPDRVWTPEELVGELRSSEVVVAQSIENLIMCGLVLVEDGGKVRYGPASREQDRLVRELEEEYRKKPTAIRRMIIQNPAEKLRTFADAFMLKKN